jgi:hypothetical protein
MFYKPRGWSGSGYTGVSLPALNGAVSYGYSLGERPTFRMSCPNGLRTERFSEDIYNAWKNFKDYKADNPGANNSTLVHTETLEKVAINHIYFLLNDRTRRYIQNANLEDLRSAVNELKRVAQYAIIAPDAPNYN